MFIYHSKAVESMLLRIHGNALQGLLNTFSTIFALNSDALYAIKTPENFFDFLRMVSEQSRLLQARLLKKHSP